MDTITNTPVVIVTEDKRRRKGLAMVIGATAAGAIVLGGGTFALWSASDSFTGGEITAGDLNIVQTEDTTVWDVSDDRDDATDVVMGTAGTDEVLGHEISDTDEWRMVPGDTVAFTQSADLTLVGDNLVASLSLTTAAGDVIDDGFTAGAGVEVTFSVWQNETLVLDRADTDDLVDGTLLFFTSLNYQGDDDADTTVIAMENDGDDDYTDEITVVVFVEFLDSNDDRENVEAILSLAGLTMTVEQVRDAGAVFS